VRELSESQTRTAAAAAEERHRIEGLLHDSAQNRLVALIVGLGLARERAERHSPGMAAELDGLIRDAEAVGDELRRIASGSPPPMLAAHGLKGALETECAASALPVRIAVADIGRSDPEVEAAVYLCCLEAVQNAAKHAGRTASVTISARREGRELAFSVRDTGQGFDAAAVARHRSAVSSQTRVRAVGGQAGVVSAPGAGTTVAGRVPWPPRE
jgi:signal transduction histidine kinase